MSIILKLNTWERVELTEFILGTQKGGLDDIRPLVALLDILVLTENERTLVRWRIEESGMIVWDNAAHHFELSFTDKEFWLLADITLRHTEWMPNHLTIVMLEKIKSARDATNIGELYD